MEIKLITTPEVISRIEVASMIKKSVDYVDNAVYMDKLDYAVLSGSKPIVKNEKYHAFLISNGYKFKKSNNANRNNLRTP